MRPSSADLGIRRYPQTWVLLDVVDRAPRLVGHEVVDLSPGAIELRHVVRSMRRYSENPERWLPVRDARIEVNAGEAHRRLLSFGPEVLYCIEQDRRRTIHGGRPFRHLAVQLSASVLTPATAAEIGLYFYGRRPATFGYTRADRAHGFIGLEWEQLGTQDIAWLLERETRAAP